MTDSVHLGLYELAFLAGGAARVVDTALVALVESGRVRVHAPGELAVVEPGRSHPVEAAVMDAVGTHGHRSVDTIRWRLAGDERLTEVGRTLADLGLLRRRPFASRKQYGRAWSTTKPGRQALLRAEQQPSPDAALDGGSAVRVALHGRPALAEDLRSAIFERPLAPVVPGGIGRRLREAEDRAVDRAAYRAQQAAVGGASIGFLEGGVGDGGGF